MVDPPSKRRAMRRRTNSRIADVLLWKASRHLPGGQMRAAFANILVAIRLSPLRAFRPGSYKKLAKRLVLRNHAFGMH